MFLLEAPLFCFPVAVSRMCHYEMSFSTIYTSQHFYDLTLYAYNDGPPENERGREAANNHITWDVI